MPEPKPERVSNVVNIQTWYVVREGYYLGYDDRVGAFVCSDRKASNANSFYDGTEVANIVHDFYWEKYLRKGKQLTRSEFMKLVEAKLPWAALQKCYKRENNWNNFVTPIRFNFDSPTLVM